MNIRTLFCRGVMVCSLVLLTSACSTGLRTGLFGTLFDKKSSSRQSQPSSANLPDVRENKQYPKTDKRAYSRYDIRNNLDVIKQLRPKPYGTEIIDPNIWVYTKEFAQRFHMPKRWIGGKDFKGALALAYHIDRFNKKDCGYWGSFDNCREIEEKCRLDIYLPHDSKTVPWNTDKMYYRSVRNRSKHFLRRVHYKNPNVPSPVKGVDFLRYLEKSKDYLTEQSYQDLKSAYDETGIYQVFTVSNFDKDGFGYGNWLIIVLEFHRNVMQGIDVITIESVCGFAESGDGEARIFFNEKPDGSEESKRKGAYNRALIKKANIRRKEAHKDMKSNHTITPGADFMKRVKIHHDANRKHHIFDDLMKMKK